MAHRDWYKCSNCGHKWQTRKKKGGPPSCPSCNSKSFENTSKIERKRKKRKRQKRRKERKRRRERRKKKRAEFLNKLKQKIPFLKTKNQETGYGCKTESNDLLQVPSKENPVEQFEEWSESNQQREKLAGDLCRKLVDLGYDKRMLHTIFFRIKESDIAIEKLESSIESAEKEKTIEEILKSLEIEKYMIWNETDFYTMIK